MAKLQELIKSGYQFMGGVSTEEMPLAVFLNNLYNAIDKRLVDLKLSDSNFLLKKYEFVQGDGVTLEFPINISDFGEAVRLESSTDQISYGGNIPFVNHANIFIARNESRMVAAIYGVNPPTLEFSFAPDVSISIRLWYEPSKGAPLRLTQEPELNSYFQSVCAVEAALMSVMDIEGRPSDWVRAKQESLMRTLAEWERRWVVYLMKPQNQGVVRKRRYNERRTRNRWQ